jgi:hypothetical protein
MRCALRKLLFDPPANQFGISNGFPIVDQARLPTLNQRRERFSKRRTVARPVEQNDQLAGKISVQIHAPMPEGGQSFIMITLVAGQRAGDGALADFRDDRRRPCVKLHHARRVTAQEQHA